MQTCAVIGCGPAGIAAATALRQCGMMVTCFEVGSTPGGVWATNSRDLFSSRSLVSPIYPTMRCVLPKELMCFSDMRFDYTVPQFPHHSSVASYLDAYARRRGVHTLTRFNTKAESVRLDPADGAWKVVTVNVKNGDVLEWAFDRVCVCTGQTQAARFPAGLREGPLAAFAAAGGEVHHSSHVKDFRGLRGRRVAVVGDGVSAYDYCAELQRNGAEVVHSSLGALYSRPPPAAALAAPPRQSATATGEPSAARDAVAALADLASRVPGWRADVHRGNDVVRRWLRSRNLGLRDLRRVGAPLSSEGRGILFGDPLPPQGALPAAPSSAAAAADTGGVFIDNVDVVICATGYTLSFPFLHRSVRDAVEGETLLLADGSAAGGDVAAAPSAAHNTRGLYMGTILRDAPSLAFVGIQRELLPPFLMFEAQARFVAYAFTGRAELPPDAAAMAAAEEELVRRSPVLADLYAPDGIGLSCAVYFNALQRLLQISSTDTYTAKVLERRWWLLASSALRLYHSVRALAPLKRKKQHLLFSNEV